MTHIKVEFQEMVGCLKKDYSYCTLFDINYLDKGIVTINSLLESGVTGNVYVLAMDEQCEDVLSDYYLNQKITIISLDNILYKELHRVRKERSQAEFCWTCTASLIEYILKTYQEDICTYIDADMYFYCNPNVLVDEMVNSDKSVQIIEHRFRDDFFGRENIKAAGRFCVEFNTFKNDDLGRKVLREWKRNTIESCASTSSTNNHLGDQFYLTEWPERYTCVNIIQNIGAGIAPWNICRYAYIGEKNGRILLSFDGMGEYEPVFYHFHNISYIDRNTVDINVFRHQVGINKEVVEKIYFSYLLLIDKTKNMLQENYDVYPFLQHHPGIVEKRSMRYYLGKVFSRRLLQNIMVKMRNMIAERNHKYDVYKISDIYRMVLP